jgi:cytochrome c biogenesis protein CcmG, thiol:disulfide interchange protein DsbE
MKNRVSRIIVMLLVVGAFTYFILNLDKGETTGLGEPAIDFQLEDIDGNLQSLSDYKGQVVVINFFATWCGPCVDEAPELEAFEQQYGDKVKLLILDLGETRDRVKKFIEKHNTTSTYLFDYKMDIKDQFGVTGQPETFVIDKEGVIREHYKGPLTKDDLYNLVADYL